jgi:hypothetical protein
MKKSRGPRVWWWGLRDGLAGYPPMMPLSWTTYRKGWQLGKRIAFWRH